MERFGIDKPDLRYGLEIIDWTGKVTEEAAPFVQEAIAAGGRLRGIHAPGLAGLSRKELDGLTAVAKAAGAGGLLWARRGEQVWEGQGVKAFGAATLDVIAVEAGDLLVAVVGPDHVTSPALHAVRMALAARPDVEPRTAHAFLWVVDFPLFEQDAGSGAWIFTHHPFTAPHPDDRDHLESDPGRCRALHYDAVYNGNELGCGSIRITDPKLQQQVFRFLGIDDAEQHDRFGFLLDALAAGAPPHGGFALGFDRIAMLLSGADLAPRRDRLSQDRPGPGAVRGRPRPGPRRRSRRPAPQAPVAGVRMIADEVRQQFTAEGADPLLLAGVNDVNFLELQRALGVRVSQRGDQITVGGTAEQIEKATPVVEALIDLARVGQAISPEDVFRYATEGFQPSDLGTPGDEIKIVLPGMRRAIVPKTPGQREYLGPDRRPRHRDRHRTGRHRQDLPRGGQGGRGAGAQAGRAGSSSPGRRSRRASRSASSPATCRRRSIRTCARSTTRSRT